MPDTDLLQELIAEARASADSDCSVGTDVVNALCDEAETTVRFTVALMKALESVHSEIIEAVEIDTRWEQVATAAGWLVSDEGHGWYQQDPIWHFIDGGRAVCGGFSISGVKLIEKLDTSDGGLGCIDCVIHVMRPITEKVTT